MAQGDAHLAELSSATSSRGTDDQTSAEHTENHIGPRMDPTPVSTETIGRPLEGSRAMRRPKCISPRAIALDAEAVVPSKALNAHNAPTIPHRAGISAHEAWMIVRSSRAVAHGTPATAQHARTTPQEERATARNSRLAANKKRAIARSAGTPRARNE